MIFVTSLNITGMKKMNFPLVGLLAIAVMAFISIEPLSIGSSLPEPAKEMMDITGKKVSFSDVMKKNGLLVMFSCNTCPVVGRYQSRTLETARVATANDIGVILLNSNEATRDNGDSFEDMQRYGKDQGYDFSYVLDKNSVMANAFGATRTPEVFLFDNKGKLVYHGAIDDNANGPDKVTRQHIRIAIEELAAGRQISTTKTRFVGCTIKRVS